mmetsp:Transcript_95410/g.242463  ORF Transcript_95410/g.242463 Transcript_95410/m.242463 type:complete len:338 (+) Transcript_95410:238-1251(+)
MSMIIKSCLEGCSLRGLRRRESTDADAEGDEREGWQAERQSEWQAETKRVQDEKCESERCQDQARRADVEGAPIVRRGALDSGQDLEALNSAENSKALRQGQGLVHERRGQSQEAILLDERQDAPILQGLEQRRIPEALGLLEAAESAKWGICGHLFETGEISGLDRAGGQAEDHQRRDGKHQCGCAQRADEDPIQKVNLLRGGQGEGGTSQEQRGNQQSERSRGVCHQVLRGGQQLVLLCKLQQTQLLYRLDAKARALCRRQELLALCEREQLLLLQDLKQARGAPYHTGRHPRGLRAAGRNDEDSQRHRRANRHAGEVCCGRARKVRRNLAVLQG